MLREILQVLRSEYAFALFTASFAVLAAVIAFAIVGYLGLAILGILTLLICATMEIGKDGPLGSINTPDLHAWDAQHREAIEPRPDGVPFGLDRVPVGLDRVPGLAVVVEDLARERGEIVPNLPGLFLDPACERQVVEAQHLIDDDLAQRARVQRLERVELGRAGAEARLEGPRSALAVLDRRARQLKFDALLGGQRDRLQGDVERPFLALKEKFERSGGAA